MLWRKAVVGGALLLSVSAAAERTSRQPDRALPQRGRLIDAGGYQVRIHEAGESGPSVALVAGAGDCAASWVPVADKIATSARVTSYDRAGMGGSGNGPPPTLDQYLAELSSVIPRARADRPYILAGHSLGGPIVRIYAQQHPADVARLVLVDATPEAVAGYPAVKTGSLASAATASVFRLLPPSGFVRFLLAIGKMPLYPEQDLFRSAVSAEDYRRWTAAVCRDFAGAAGPELRSVLPTAAASQRRRAGTTAPQFGDLSLGVPTSHAWGAKWIETHPELAARSRSSFHQITGKRSHNGHICHPAWPLMPSVMSPAALTCIPQNRAYDFASPGGVTSPPRKPARRSIGLAVRLQAHSSWHFAVVDGEAHKRSSRSRTAYYVPPSPTEDEG